MTKCVIYTSSNHIQINNITDTTNTKWARQQGSTALAAALKRKGRKRIITITVHSRISFAALLPRSAVQRSVNGPLCCNAFKLLTVWHDTACFQTATLIYLGLLLVSGEPLPESDALAWRQGGQLIKRAVRLAHALVVWVSIVIEHEDLECPPCQLGRRYVEDELLLELWTQSSTMNAALQLSSTVRQQTETTERVGGAAELTRYEISRLHALINLFTRFLRRTYENLRRIQENSCYSEASPICGMIYF